MADHAKVAVYVPAEDARRLREAGLEPAEWVRRVVAGALTARRVGEQDATSVEAAAAAAARRRRAEAGLVEDVVAARRSQDHRAAGSESGGGSPRGAAPARPDGGKFKPDPKPGKK